jgi:hypothetical protein
MLTFGKNVKKNPGYPVVGAPGPRVFGMARDNVAVFGW